MPDAYRVTVGGGIGVVGSVDLTFAPDRSFQGIALSGGFGFGARGGAAGVAQENLAGPPDTPPPRFTFGTSVSYSPLAIGPLAGFDTRIGRGEFAEASFSGGLAVGAPIFACAPCVSLNISRSDLGAWLAPLIAQGSGIPGHAGPPPISAVPPF